MEVYGVIPCSKGWSEDACYDEGDLNGCGLDGDKVCNRNGTCSIKLKIDDPRVQEFLSQGLTSRLSVGKIGFSEGIKVRGD